MSTATLEQFVDEKLRAFQHRDLIAQRDVIDLLLDLRQLLALEAVPVQEAPEGRMYEAVVTH